jgi:hypothetical protein
MTSKEAQAQQDERDRNIPLKDLDLLEDKRKLKLAPEQGI